MTEKLRDKYPKQFTSILNDKLQVFSFRVIILKSNAFSHSSLRRYYALLDALKLRCCGTLDGLNVFKRFPFDNLPELR